MVCNISEQSHAENITHVAPHISTWQKMAETGLCFLEASVQMCAANRVQWHIGLEAKTSGATFCLMALDSWCTSIRTLTYTSMRVAFGIWVYSLIVVRFRTLALLQIWEKHIHLWKVETRTIPHWCTHERKLSPPGHIVWITAHRKVQRLEQQSALVQGHLRAKPEQAENSKANKIK